MVLAGVIVAMVVVMFLLGVVAPRFSRRAEAVRDRVMFRGESKAERKVPGKPGDLASDAIDVTRRAGARAAEAGRKTHRTVTPGE